VNASEIPLNVLAEAAADGVILIDDQSIILFVNPAAGQIFGYQPAQMVGNNLTSLMPEYLRQIHMTSLKRYIGTGQRHMSWRSVELTGLHKSGREFPIEVSFTEHTSQGRRFFTGFVRDVTERKQAQERFRLAVEASPNGIVLVNAQGKIMLANACVEKLFGYQRQELTGQAVERTEWDGDGAVRASVRDFGTGLPADLPERVFDRFFSTKGEGMGVGLFIARSIVAAHGGTLFAENAEGGGAQFWVRLPVSKEIGG
jgi:PAS domain S-box-containing protein